MVKIKCPVEGCNFECKPKGLSAHMRHRHPDLVDEEDCDPSPLNATYKFLMWFANNLYYVIFGVIIMLMAN